MFDGVRVAHVVCVVGLAVSSCKDDGSGVGVASRTAPADLNAPAATVALPERTAQVVHRAESPRLTFVSWSPYRDVVAYRLLPAGWDPYAPSPLSFYDAETAASCEWSTPVGFFPVDGRRPVEWMASGGVLVAAPDGRSYLGHPCGVAALASDLVTSSCEWRMTSSSPSKEFVATTQMTTSAAGYSHFVTSIDGHDEPMAEYAWSEPQRKGDACEFDYAVKWIDVDKVLISTIGEAGAVILNVDGTVTSASRLVRGTTDGDGSPPETHVSGAFLGTAGRFRLLSSAEPLVLFRSELSDREELPAGVSVPSLSPDGRWVVANELTPQSSAAGVGQIGIRSTVSVPMRVEVLEGSVAEDQYLTWKWSPASDFLAVRSHEGLRIFRVDSPGDVVLTSVVRATPGWTLLPGWWAPSSDFLAVIADGEGGQGLQIVKVDSE